MPAPSRTGLSPLKALAFSGPALPIGALAVALPVYLPHYYASDLGLKLSVVGLAFTIVRLIDILFDPAIGLAMDRTHTRLGRYRLWMACGAAPFMLAIYQLFMAPHGIGYGYLIGWLLAFYIPYSVLLLSHLSWSAAIAPEYNQRSRLFGWIQIIGVAGACAVLFVPNIHAMGWLVIASVPVGVLLALATTPEPLNAVETAERFKLRDYWEMIARPDMRRIIVADFCLQLGPNWMASLYLFYFHDLRGFSVAQSNILLLIYVASGFAGAIALSRAATKFGKHQTLMASCLGYSIGLLGLVLLPKANVLAAAPLMFAIGFLATSFTLLDRAMVADVGDAVRLESGRQRISLLYAMITSTQKIAGALSIGLTYVALDLIGYNAAPGALNTPSALLGLALVFLVGPVVFVLLGGACYIGYKLNAARHAEIRTALDLRDAESQTSA